MKSIFAALLLGLTAAWLPVNAQGINGGMITGQAFLNWLASPPCVGCASANSGVFTTLAASGPFNGSLVGGQGTYNPYAGPYPGFLYGIGGTGFYNGANTLATNAFYNGSGNITISNPYPFGMLDTAVAGSFNTGSARPPCVNGYTAPSQVGYIGFENGAAGLCSAADSQPVMTSAAGTFTATGVTPASPIEQSPSVFAAVGMWVRSSDMPPFNGQITSFAVDGSNRITGITVSNWYQEGGNGRARTPAGSILYMNPQDKIWSSLGAIYLNRFQVTGNVTNGSNSITNVSNTSNIFPGGQFIQTNTSLFPYKTWITGVSGTTVTVSANAKGTLSGETLNISAGSAMNAGVEREIDLFDNVGASYTPVTVTGTASTTNGSNVLTRVTNITSLYPSVLFRTNANLSGEATILSVNVAGGSIMLGQKATGTGSVTYQARSRFDEGGAGEDCVSLGFPGNTCFNQRGQVAYGYRSNGAGVASFISQPDPLSGNVSPYGFLADETYGNFGTAPLALVSGGTSLWHVDQFGNTFSAAILLRPSTIAGLQTCTPSIAGLVKYVSDTVAKATAAFHGAVMGGGSTAVNSLVLCTGSQWQYE